MGRRVGSPNHIGNRLAHRRAVSRGRAILGLYSLPGATLQSVGDRLGLTRERVRQMIKVALQEDADANVRSILAAKPAPAPGWIRLSEVASRHNVHQGTLTHRLHARGYIKRIKIGATLWVPEADAHELLTDGHRGKLPEPLDVRLWRFVRRLDDRDGGHWLWTGTVSIKGYPMLSLSVPSKAAIEAGEDRWKKPIMPRKYILSLATGVPIGPGERVYSTCEERRCCNPTHLFIFNWGDKIRRKVTASQDQANAIWQQFGVREAIGTYNVDITQDEGGEAI